MAVARDRKEVRFFDRHFARGVDWYGALFDHAGPDQITGEVSPNYLWHPEAPARIHRVVPQVRLVAILRNPVQRAWSQYKHAIIEEGETQPFRQFVEAHADVLDRGNYATQLERYQALFAPEQLLVLFFEEVVPDPARAMVGVYRFLDVDPDFVAPSADRVMNKSARPRFHRLYVAGRRGLKLLHDNDMSWGGGGVQACRCEACVLRGPVQAHAQHRRRRPALARGPLRRPDGGGGPAARSRHSLVGVSPRRPRP